MATFQRQSLTPRGWGTARPRVLHHTSWRSAVLGFQLWADRRLIPAETCLRFSRTAAVLQAQ